MISIFQLNLQPKEIYKGLEKIKIRASMCPITSFTSSNFIKNGICAGNYFGDIYFIQTISVLINLTIS